MNRFASTSRALLVASLLLTACGGGGGGGGPPVATGPIGRVTTLAGSTSPDGIGRSARFRSPHGVVRDGPYLYVADAGNQTIRRVEIATAAVTTIAGATGQAGSADGTGSAARFSSPHDLASDGTSLYVTDCGNQTIRRVALATGQVTTLAGGAGVAGSADGTGVAARFNGPSGILRVGGNLYVTDYGSHTIRRVEIATGAVTTLAGLAGTAGSADGVGAVARFNSPYGLASDGTNLFVTDFGNYTIRAVALATGTVSTLAGWAGSPGGTDGIGSAARFSGSLGIFHDAGVLYVADMYGDTIRAIHVATAAVSTLAGSSSVNGTADGVGAAARFWSPRGVAGDGTNLFVVDTGTGLVRAIEIATAAVTTLAGGGWSSDGLGAAARFRSPQGVALDRAGNAYVADTDSHTIRKVTPRGEVTTVAGAEGQWGHADGTGAAARFYYPSGIAVDGSGNLYVGDTSNQVIRKITPAAEVSTLAGTAGMEGFADGPGGTALFNTPFGVAVDGTGNVYVADANNHLIRKITPGGAVSTLAGAAGISGSADGSGAAARFNSPCGVAVDAAGVVYVAESGNGVIRRITPAGVVSTLAGTAGIWGDVDGTGAAARFNTPSGVAVDAAGVVYVADSDNNMIRAVSQAGEVTTLAGVSGTSGAADGTGTAARFAYPTGVAISGSRLLVADSDNGLIRSIE